MNILPNNDKIEKYLDELADEYRDLLYKAFLSRTKSLDDLSVSELLRLDNEIKKPLLEDYPRKQRLQRKFLILSFIYVVIGVILYIYSKIISENFIYSREYKLVIMSFIITFFGVMLAVYSFALQTLNIGVPRYNTKMEDSSQILEYKIMLKWRELEGIVNDISMNLKVKTTHSIIQFLKENKFIDDEEYNILKSFLKIRNDIVHATNSRHTNKELKTMLDEIDKIINKIKKIL